MLKPRPCLALLALLALVGGLLPAPPVRAADLTLEDERKMGREYFNEVRRQVRFVEDPDSVNYVRELGRRLVEALGDTRYDYTFYIADLGEMNAVSLPAGYIIFFRGMIASLESEGELAAVMAHEISHVYFRHIAERLRKSTPAQVASIAGLVAGLLLGVLTGAPQLGSAIGIGSMAGGVTQQLAFSREDEQQADYGGYRLMTQLGYPPADMERTFERIWREQRMAMSDPPAYLLSHPTSPERMEVIQGLARRHDTVVKPYDNDEFLRIRTRLTALYGPVDQTRTVFENRLRGNRPDAEAMYGLALVEMRRSRYKEALNVLAVLDRLWKDSPHVRRERAECNLALGNYEEANRLFGLTLLSLPGDQDALLGLGQSYLGMNQLELARDAFQRLLASHPDDSQARHDLGVVMGRLGQTAEASFHLGLAFKQRGNNRMAVYHLQRAIKELKDPLKIEQAKAALEEADAGYAREQAREREERQRRDNAPTPQPNTSRVGR